MASDDIDGVAEFGVRRSERKIQLTAKALQNAIEDKQRDIFRSCRKLLIVMRSVEEARDDSDINAKASDLTAATDEFGSLLQGLLSLYKQDLHGEFVDGAQLKEENEILRRALLLIDSLKNRIARQSDELSDTPSVVRSRHSSRRSLASSTSSSPARLQALADARAASQEAQYARLIAEKELERRTRDAEAERIRQQEQAQFEKEMAILGADKRAAVANAKLKVFEDAFLEEGLREEFDLQELKHPQIKTEERTSQWVDSSPLQDLSPTGNLSRPETAPKPQTASEEAKPSSSPPPKPKMSEKTGRSHFQTSDPESDHKFNDSHAALNQQPLTTSTPLRDNAGSQLIDSLMVVNQQVVAGLARQNLPKCQPDVFSGDPTLFHPWKSAFKAMLIDTDVSPTQEINYLGNFTSGTPQRLVDNYRKRQMRDPVALLRKLWEELERRFGSAAVISNTLLERLCNSATFSEHDNENLQQFADLCADIESQVTYLPGLACLNYPSAIQPVTEKLPQFIRAKWEKEIAHYSDLNGGAYPPFSRFSGLVIEQAKIKNNPNLLTNKEAKPRREKKTLKTDMTPSDEKKGDSGNEKREGHHGKSKHCPFHDRPGHELSEYKTFLAKTLNERTQWIKDTRLCFRCLSPTHIASRCNVPLKCTICGDRHHSALMHRDRRPPPKSEPRSENEGVNPKCTTLCGPSGGVYCSRPLLVDYTASVARTLLSAFMPSSMSKATVPWSRVS